VKKRRDPFTTEDDIRRRTRRHVRKLREGQSLTQRDAAARVGMGRRHWQKVEGGETNLTLETLARLSVALGVDDPVKLLEEPPKRAPGTSGEG